SNNANSSSDSSDNSNNDSNSNLNDDAEELKINLAHNLPVELHTARGAQMFADLVQEKSNDKIKINIFPSGQLYDDTSMAEAVTSGQIEMGLNVFTMWSGQMPTSEL